MAWHGGKGREEEKRDQLEGIGQLGDTTGPWDLLAFPSKTALGGGPALFSVSILRGAEEVFNPFYGGRNEFDISTELGH